MMIILRLQKVLSPPKYTNELLLLDLGLGRGNVGPIGKGFEVYSRFIARCIFDKARKTYSQNGPVILAISLSLLPNSIDISTAHNFVKSIIDTGLFKTHLKEFFKGEYPTGLQNISAIIIDRSWYNWSKALLAAQGISIPTSWENCFDIIYNTSSPHFNEKLFFLNDLAKGSIIEFDFSCITDKNTEPYLSIQRF